MFKQLRRNKKTSALAYTSQPYGVQSVVVPCHYDLFSFNTAGVSEFAGLADEAGIAYRVLHPGEKWLWSQA